mmetsp:Transcript_34965/g.74598  ORF Transcript_34965/g.74598 Transcript_34965/m.74598 type:complete len:231 (-) Transcript_34965:151-843(-)|eukprot:CAMPEP_0172541844 /NCGR_PEP_ID=MMETSP1067-20121228/12591_1 /TAXON_ID=265564 ORGANISM="Thalassiosira punctigera, Strain Tpunct2005C2" /NCGR_SAMPLE_ID=MMETSP1067 /ASSEMBLY_ACC=CAM_ASM_000444 /LENGTH=230 /DNA_ID=CAMNT_0013327967 /DNA_START=140 /DNA_END=832 /DNA_ORIENTATION=+
MGSCSSKEEVPPRVLVLHGDGLNAEILKIQFETLDQKLQRDQIELVFINGCEETDPHPDLQGAEGTFYRYFNFNPERKKYDGAQGALDYVEDIIKKRGPFGGVIGFSQGGAVATLLAARQQSSGGRLPGSQCKLSYAIIMGAPHFIKVDESPGKELLGGGGVGQLQIPSMHVIGEEDKFKTPYIDDMVKLYKKPKVLYHKDGHRPFPANFGEQNHIAREIATFIRKKTYS